MALDSCLMRSRREVSWNQLNGVDMAWAVIIIVIVIRIVRHVPSTRCVKENTVEVARYQGFTGLEMVGGKRYWYAHSFQYVYCCCRCRCRWF